MQNGSIQSRRWMESKEGRWPWVLESLLGILASQSQHSGLSCCRIRELIGDVEVEAGVSEILHDF